MGTTAPGRKKIRPPFGRQQACGQKRPPLRTAASVYAHIFYSISYFFVFVNRLLHIFGHFSPNNARPQPFSKRNSTHTRVPFPPKKAEKPDHMQNLHMIRSFRLQMISYLIQFAFPCIQFIIPSFLRQQLLMVAALDNLTVLQNHDCIRITHRG